MFLFQSFPLHASRKLPKDRSHGEGHLSKARHWIQRNKDAVRSFLHGLGVSCITRSVAKHHNSLILMLFCYILACCDNPDQRGIMSITRLWLACKHLTSSWPRRTFWSHDRRLAQHVNKVWVEHIALDRLTRWLLTALETSAKPKSQIEFR